jgi:hypothetical protein
VKIHRPLTLRLGASPQSSASLQKGVRGISSDTSKAVPAELSFGGTF